MSKVAVFAVIVLGVLAAPALASAGTLFVSHTATPGAADKSCATAAYSTVQSAVDASGNGGQIYLCSAVPYTESVLIQKDVSVGGDPGATIQAPADAAVPGTYFSSQGLETPNSVVTIIGAHVQLNGLTIEGPFVNSGCGGDDFGVLAIGGAQLQMKNDTVLNVEAADQAGLGGCQYGVGIQVGREYWPTTTGAFVVEDFVGQAQIQSTSVSGYQKNGITIDGPGSQGHVQSSTVDGGGLNAIIARNGIQVSRGATAQIEGNSVSGNEYTGPGSFASATGVLVYGGCGDPLSTNVQVHNNTLTNNDTGVSVSDFDPTCSTAPSTATNNQVHDNTISKNDGVTNHSPFTDENGNPYSGYQVGVGETGNNDQVHNNTITSTDGAYGPLVTPGGPFLAPIDIQTYPPVHTQVHNNTYNGAPTNPPY